MAPKRAPSQTQSLSCDHSPLGVSPLLIPHLALCLPFCADASLMSSLHGLDVCLTFSAIPPLLQFFVHCGLVNCHPSVVPWVHTQITSYLRREIIQL